MAKGANSLSKTAVWILMGLLIVGLAGFGATNFSGTVRSIGAVGDTEISTTDYARALQNEIRAIQAERGGPYSLQQAQNDGITDQVLTRLVISAALEDEADRLGLSVGDARVAAELRAISAFQGPDGGFSRDAYAFALDNAGLSEAEFEADLRAESATTLLQAGVIAGTVLPDTYADTILAFAAERRDVTWARLGPSALDTGIPAPQDGALRAFHEENIDRYTRPVTREITYVWLTPDMILDTVEVPESALREAYEERLSEFNQPERRLVERLVFRDDAAAEAALARIESGDASFEDIVTERGLALSDTDMGDLARDDLDDAADAVFALDTGAVTVAPSPLGPALYRVNGRLAARETSFEEAVPMLRDTLALDRARRVIEAQAQSYDDELAAGATLEQLAAETDLRLGQIGWTGRENGGGIAGYESFREAADSVTQDDFPEIDGLGDGGVFALRLDAVRDAAPIPFDEVADRVRDDWEAAQRREALLARAETLVDRLEQGESFADLGLTPRDVDGLTRNAFTLDLPPQLIATAFELEEGGIVAVPGGDGALILRLDAVAPPDPESEDTARLRDAVAEQAANAIASDLFRALASDIQQRAGVEIDRQAINAVHANIQ